ncbi:MAG: cyanophycinase [Planctomycetota bacterium]|jgi:cyanophycinase
MNRLHLIAFLIVASPAMAQVFDERFEDWPVDLRIRGTAVVASSLPDVAVLGRARINLPDGARVVALVDDGVTDARAASYRSAFSVDEEQFETVRYAGDAVELGRLLEACEVLCWETSREPTSEERDHWLAARGAFSAHVAAGGVVVAVGPGARLLGAHLPGDAFGVTRSGIGLLPDTSIDVTFGGTRAAWSELMGVQASSARCVAIGLHPDTALVLRGRRCSVVGAGRASFMLSANDRQPHRLQDITQRTVRSQGPTETLLDLTEWRRDAIDRTLEPFPAAEPQPPVVDDGTLLIVGGGGLPDGLMERFIELAGGKSDARLVYVPCSEDDTVDDRQRMVEAWKRQGVLQATFIHTKDRTRANEDEEFLAALDGATGIWFGGGRQWNFADSYYGTKAHRLMKDVLARGGVIGGSSAGASIQGRYLARATPIQNFEIMAPGYERGGLGFLSGVAIDQHFTQRGRQKDMTALVNRHPQLLGIGIDETTAIEVSGSLARVVGAGRVFFYDRRQPVIPGQPDYLAVPDGKTFDLVRRAIVERAPGSGPR